MKERRRYQLVIALGEGQAGADLRELLDAHAAAAGKPVSVWARETLIREAGLAPYGERLEADLRLLTSRVSVLEELLSKVAIAEYLVKDRAGKRRR